MTEQTEKLRQEILEDARKRVARNEKRGQREAENILQETRTKLEQFRKEHLAESEARAAEKVRAIQAGIEQEIRRQWLIRRETVLDAVFSGALEQLAAAPEAAHRAELESLLCEAVRQIGPVPGLVIFGHPTVLNLLPIERVKALVETTLTDGCKAPEAHLQPDEALGDGIVVESTDGRLRCDNTLEARIARLRKVLRPLAAGILGDGEDAVVQADSRPNSDGTEE